MRHNPTKKEEFRDMLATSDVRRLIANAIRSERHCPSLTHCEVDMFQRLRDGLKDVNERFVSDRRPIHIAA